MEQWTSKDNDHRWYTALWLIDSKCYESSDVQIRRLLQLVCKAPISAMFDLKTGLYADSTIFRVKKFAPDTKKKNFLKIMIRAEIKDIQYALMCTILYPLLFYTGDNSVFWRGGTAQGDTWKCEQSLVNHNSHVVLSFTFGLKFVVGPTYSCWALGVPQGWWSLKHSLQ